MANPRKAWKIEPVLLTDAPALARNNVAAWWPDAQWRLSYDGTGVTPEQLTAQKAREIPADLLHRRDILRHAKAVDPDTGALVGYMRVALPVEVAIGADGLPTWGRFRTAEVGAEEEARIRDVAERAAGETKEAENRSDDVAFAIQKRILDDGNYIKLRYLAVHPENQRRGIGQALVRCLLDEADRLGIDVYAMAHAAGRPTYAKLGFHEIERHVEDLSKHGGEGEHAVYYMIYRATKKDTSDSTIQD